MTDREVIRKVKELKDREYELMDIASQKGDEAEKAKNRADAPSLSLRILGVGILGLIIGNIVTDIGILIAAITVAGGVLGYVWYKKAMVTYEENLPELKREVALAEAEFDVAMKNLADFVESPEYTEIIPERFPVKYTAPAQLELIYGYFEDHRADTVKEAINLLESEAKMNAILTAQENQLKELAKSNETAATIVEQNKKMEKLQKQTRNSQRWNTWWSFHSSLK